MVAIDDITRFIGCSRSEVMECLLQLYNEGLGELYLSVYHKSHADAPIMIRSLLDGFPDVPFVCSCAKVVNSRGELLFDFLFGANMFGNVTIGF